LAAILTGLQTFLDLPTLGERHRTAAVKYKIAIRFLEQAIQGSVLDNEQLDALETDAPIVMFTIHDTIEKRFANVSFVKAAVELYAKADKKS
jgi:hypothetical protein